MDSACTSASYAQVTSTPLVVHLAISSEEGFEDADPRGVNESPSPADDQMDQQVEEHLMTSEKDRNQDLGLTEEKLKNYTTVRSIRFACKGRCQLAEVITACEEITGSLGNVEQVCIKPNNTVEVGLTTVEAKEKLIGHTLKVGDLNVICESLDEDLLMVTVKYVPNEADKDLVRSILSEYGKVNKVLVHTVTVSGRKFKTGTYRVLIKTRKLLPNYVEMLGNRVELQYVGRKKQCWRCSSLNHEIRECTVKLCHRCKSPHHMVRDCPKCYNCKQTHNREEECPKQTLLEIYKTGGRNKTKERKREKSLERQKAQINEQRENQKEKDREDKREHEHESEGDQEKRETEVEPMESIKKQTEMDTENQTDKIENKPNNRNESLEDRIEEQKNITLVREKILSISLDASLTKDELIEQVENVITVADKRKTRKSKRINAHSNSNIQTKQN
ncbi:uncharacterized protein LOC111621765 [Centruroides sculpturatus]|uniref:uncharacterized protein LOC111621765 n=1 Tax=Centruroides sculpturatus TaxID=218467 RepID=UPI000C6E5175|nr:uncharacterized protein LOC111621765 [Centruroides sculpturatus]